MEDLLPLDRAGHLFGQQLHDTGRPVVAVTRHVGVDGDDRGLDGDRPEHLLERFLGGAHQGRVEGPAHRQPLDSTDAEVRGVLLHEL